MPPPQPPSSARRRRRLAGAVFAKELRETLRDRRVILGVIVSPLLLIPLLAAVAGYFAGVKTAERRSEILAVAVVGGDALPALAERLRADATLEIRTLPNRAAAEAAAREKAVRAALLVPGEAPRSLERRAPVPLEILYSVASEKSEVARQRLRRHIEAFDRAALEARLAEAGLPETFAQPTRVAQTSVADPASVGGFLLSFILPYVVVMGAAFGGATTAFDLGAGEKERGTMETLLASPAPREAVALGKLLCVAAVSFLSALCSIAGIVIALGSGLALFEASLGDSVGLSYRSLAALPVVVLPLSLLMSSVLLAISSFARNQKEAQTYLFPFMIAVLLPAVLSSLLGAESPLYAALVPALNAALAMKQILGQAFDPVFFALTLASSLAYAYLAMRLAAALFQREAVLFRA